MPTLKSSSLFTFSSALSRPASAHNPQQVAELLGDDHEFSREVLDEVKKARPNETAGEVTLTLMEFKQLMLKRGGERGGEANAAERRRRKHEHIAVDAVVVGLETDGV